MVKVRQAFVALRIESRPLIVLRVCSFEFFRLGLTEVHWAAPILSGLKGRQFQSLGQAAHEVHVLLFGRDEGYCNYTSEYEAYCIGRFDETWDARLGKGSRVVDAHGQRLHQSFSPDLLNTYVELAPDSLANGGRWVRCCDLLPLVPLGMSDSDAAARLARELDPSRNRRLAPGGAHAADGSSGHDRDDWRSGRAQGSGASSGDCHRGLAHGGACGLARGASENAPPKRARFSTKNGLCVYRRMGDVDMPHEIVDHRLVEQAVHGQNSMKMLMIRPLDPPGARQFEVPYVETVPLNDRFKEVWCNKGWDPGPDGSTGRPHSNAGLYDAHVTAVKLQARTAKQPEVALFHQLRWGHNVLALSPPPPELEGAGDALLPVA